MDSDGILVDELENQLKKHLPNQSEQKQRKSVYNGMLYLIPVLQNPTGINLSKGERRY